MDLLDSTDHIYINGRFLAQPLAGVQRYATEMSRALLTLYPDRITVLAPPDAAPGGLGERRVGFLRGQLWEQLELPWYARRGYLMNFGNTAPMLGRKQAVVFHDAGVFRTPEAYFWKFRVWYKFLQFALSRTTAQLITVSSFSKVELANNLAVKESRIAVAGEGIDHMARVTSDPDVLRAHDLTRQGYVLVVGTLAAHKNLQALNELANRLVGRGMNLAVTGAFGAVAFQSGGQKSLPAAARYLGRVSDSALKALFENAACFVFPSRYEGFGLPPVEAMACGCAVVASDIPALRECCGDAAIYCDSRSPSAIADVVMNLLGDAPRLEHFRLSARKHVETLTWDTAARRLLASITHLPVQP
jgi:glycosyltransferase involved in cell wall biosynthesis